jgi:hypothetical protein
VHWGQIAIPCEDAPGLASNRASSHGQRIRPRFRAIGPESGQCDGPGGGLNRRSGRLAEKSLLRDGKSEPAGAAEDVGRGVDVVALRAGNVSSGRRSRGCGRCACRLCASGCHCSRSWRPRGGRRRGCRSSGRSGRLGWGRGAGRRRLNTCGGWLARGRANRGARTHRARRSPRRGSHGPSERRRSRLDRAQSVRWRSRRERPRGRVVRKLGTTAEAEFVVVLIVLGALRTRDHAGLRSRSPLGRVSTPFGEGQDVRA